MAETTDPTFYRSPTAAIAAPPESLAYVAAFDPAGEKRDAMAVVDCDADSSTYGNVVGSTVSHGVVCGGCLGRLRGAGAQRR